ncbi:ABC transporter ATP-binding protein [Quadrisphaera sp. DSM 44207]|uniref:ABC transporter ATP-binding protein n=1 Tax=Quadrisphaera sp. DSM 44207 TaxID=1881057 RepID=UPI00088CD9FE|nr:ABC transporter ATP-binding protein [Quadrisphaera sp. DSM 44207]SDQ89159.1 ATP-binding cassette, subfamily B [Quadrisphaera sp. DSM 44207]
MSRGRPSPGSARRRGRPGEREEAALGPVAGLRLLAPHLRRHRTALAAAVLLSLLGAVTALAQPLLVGRVITAVEQGTALVPVVTALVAVLLAGSLVGAVQQYLLERSGEGVVLSVRRSLVERLLRLRVAEHDRATSGDLLSRVGSDTTLLRSVVTSGLFEVASQLLTGLGALVLMGLIDVVLLAVTLVAVAVGATAGVLVGSRLGALGLQAQRRVGDMSAAVGRALSAVRTVRASGATERETAAVLRSAAAARDAGVRAARVRAAISPIVGIAVQGAFIAVLGTGGYRVASGALSVAELVSFVLLLFALVLPLGQLLGTYATLQTGLAALTRVQEVLVLPVEEDDAPPAPAAARVARGDAPLLELDRVAFAYPDGTRALEEVSFAVPRGTRTALVGPSGAGKSTVLALVERFHDATAGAVRLDGVDVRHLPRDALRARLGYVEQEAPVLAGTLRENLLLAAPDAADAEVAAVLAAVGLTGLVSRSPQGLDAAVGEGGVLLSGGERQRLAIARSLLARPELLLLDEPTASLDARNERLLREALVQASTRSTLVVVAHRLSTVVDSDQIVVVEAGRSVAAGRHEELLETSPLYRELAATQLLV